MRNVAISLTLLLMSAVPASAWHMDGHYAIARIAWKQLSDRERIYFSNLLKKHPHYDAYLTADRPADVPENEWAFVRSAAWADWVRGPMGKGLSAEESAAIKRDFNKPVWHYVNLPFIHPSDEGKFDAEAIRKQILEPATDDKGEPRHVVAALERCMAKLKAADTPDPERAVYMCWLMHLAGDLHQPLHGTSLIAAAATIDPGFDPPSGDLGGNRWSVKWKAGGKTVRLHAYWDALLFLDEPGFAGVEEKVTELLNDPALKPDQFPELPTTDFLKWAEESRDLAKSFVYKDGDAFLKAKPLAAQNRDNGGDDVPVLSEAYQKAAAGVARKRMTLAGYRLANQLKLAVPAAP